MKKLKHKIKKGIKRQAKKLIQALGGDSLTILWKEFNAPDIKHETDAAKILARKTFGWIILAEIFLVAKPYPIKFFFDGLVAQEERTHLMGISVIILILALVTAYIHKKMEIRRNNFFWHAWSLLWGYGHHKQQRLSVDWHTQHSTGEKESLIERATDKIMWLFDEIIFNGIPRTIRIILVSIGVWWLGINFGIIAILVVSMVFTKIFWDNKKLVPFRKQFRKRIKNLERFGTELTTNWRIIKQFGLEDMLCSKNDRMLREHRDKEQPNFQAFMDRLAQQSYIIGVFEFFMYFSIPLMVYGVEELGSIILATTWMYITFNNLHQFNDMQRRIHDGGEALKDLAEVFALKPSLTQQSNPQWPETGVQGNIAINNLSFKYPNASEYVLTDVNLSINAHQCIAFVGESGSGKSTLASLVMNEYSPTQGNITIDGIDLRELNYNRYRREIIGVVSQKVQLFTGTIADNIKIVAPNITDKEIHEILIQAHLWKFIQSQPNGILTLVGEDGLHLSGGQRQRLAIARALARKPKILILDEATSALDAESQKQVQRAIDTLIQMRMATIIIIAHRFSTIMQADQVVALDKGKIAEIGTHEQLERKNGIYSKLKKMELKGLLN